MMEPDILKKYSNFFENQENTISKDEGACRFKECETDDGTYV